mmetsp:Transcript_52896/g.158340  ORF Transcript_52896/g.158340 Transcript_52896/m.158340 type:complete len:250 (-) Transcript_52896:757-1506(-)
MKRKKILLLQPRTQPTFPKSTRWPRRRSTRQRTRLPMALVLKAMPSSPLFSPLETGKHALPGCNKSANPLPRSSTASGEGGSGPEDEAPSRSFQRTEGHANKRGMAMSRRSAGGAVVTSTRLTWRSSMTTMTKTKALWKLKTAWTTTFLLGASWSPGGTRLLLSAALRGARARATSVTATRIATRFLFSRNLWQRVVFSGNLSRRRRRRCKNKARSKRCVEFLTTARKRKQPTTMRDPATLAVRLLSPQ